MRATSPREKAEQEGALRTATFFAVVLIVAVAIAIFVGSPFRHSPEEKRLLTFQLSYIAFVIVVLAVLSVYGYRLSIRLIRTVPLLLIGPAFPLSWTAHVAYARAHERYSALLGYKLIFLMFSLAPGPGVFTNALIISGFAIEAIVLWYFAGIHDVQLGVISGEPWITLLFACAAILILILQNGYRRMQKQLGELTARERITGNLSGLSLAIRDKINSPLQTLEICFESLPKNEVADAGRKSLNRIEESVRPLREFDCLINWEQKEFPAVETLIMRLREDLQKLDAGFHLRIT
jgi:hypothetical protein